MRLLSSSFDFTVVNWGCDPETETWSAESTLGALVGNKHAFFGAMFLESEDKILAYTYGGAMHQWQCENGTWHPQLTVKGHFGPVSDLDWDTSQLSLISTSADQTTRIFSEHSEPGSWYEMSRPQIHGYDMNAIVSIKRHSPEQEILTSKILSGGDEKVLRLFEAPYNYIKTINSLNPHRRTSPLLFDLSHTNDEVEQLIESEAKKQPLGLMNKQAVLLANKGTRVDDEFEGGVGSEFDPVTVLSNKNKDKDLITSITEPPVEDILMARTLWPE